MIQSVLSVLLLYLLVSLLGSITGSVIPSLKSGVSGVISLAAIIIFYSLFWLFGIEASVFTLLLFLIVSLFFRKLVIFKDLIFQFAFLSISFIIILFPYLIKFKGDTGVTGYYMNNDTLVHAVYSKGCYSNNKNSSKMYQLGIFPCGYTYPSGSHALLNLVSQPLKIPPSEFIIILNLAILPFVGLIVLTLLSQLKVNLKVSILSSLLVPQLYLLFNFSVYGFFPQTVFLALVLSSLFLLFHSKLKRLKTFWLLFMSMLIASSIIVYGFVTYIPFLVSLIMLILVNFPPDKQLVKKLGLLLIGILVLLGPHIVPNLITVSYFFKPASSISNQLFSPGNLVGFLPAKMLSGISGRIDYRYDSLDPMATKLLEPASVIFLGLAILGIFFLIKFRQKTVLLMIVTISISTLLVHVITNSPYSVSKMLSLLAPLVYISSVYAIWQISKKNTLISVFFILIYGSLMILGNFRVIKSISYISSDDLNDLGALSKLIPENASVYFATDNDWAIYYLDSENVYLDGIHYMRDVIPEGKQYDYYIYPNTSDFECTQVSETKNFKVCSNPISPKN